jgi:phosphohistidine phosphatase
MRHSKAGQTNKSMLSDHERTLTKKGEEQVQLISNYFLKNFKDVPPEVIFSSTAVRAKQTAFLFKKSYSQNTDIEIRLFPELYLTVENEILNVIKRTENSKKSILVISHVPGLQDFSVDFSNSGDKAKFRDMRANFPPGSIAVFDVEIKNWKDIKPKTGVLVDFIDAKKIKKK